MSIKEKELREIINQSDVPNLQEIINLYKDDERKGIIKLISQAQNKINKEENETHRLQTLLKFEKELYEKGYTSIGGIDEVGRGCLAGPVVSACVVLPQGISIRYADDSKKLSKEKREEVYKDIMEKASSISVGIVSSKEIDEINILEASKLSMEKAFNEAKHKIDYLLIDALTLKNIHVEQQGIIKGDQKSMSIACSSIVAKVTRDKMMEDFHSVFPEYNFLKNKGYGTKEHITALKKYGKCSIYRDTFIKNFF